MAKQNGLPVYSLNSFSKQQNGGRGFQAEVFDAKRHFAVQYPHRHDFFEVLYLKRGSGFHIIDSNKYEIKPPCVFFMSPGQAHRLELSHDVDGFIYIFTSEFFQLGSSNENSLLELPFFFTLEQTNPPLLIESASDKEFVESLFVRASDEALKSEYSAGLMHAYLNMILTYLASVYPREASVPVGGKGHLLVKRFYQLIEENYQKNLNVNQYAEMLNITPTYLTNTTKRLTGKTSVEILHDKLVVEMKRLLAQTSLDVQEISARLNFADQSYFTKFFKKATGVTPLKFRSGVEG